MINSRGELLTRLFNLHNTCFSEPGTSPRRTAKELLITIKEQARSRARCRQRKWLSPSRKRWALWGSWAPYPQVISIILNSKTTSKRYQSERNSESNILCEFWVVFVFRPTRKDHWQLATRLFGRHWEVTEDKKEIRCVTSRTSRILIRR